MRSSLPPLRPWTYALVWLSVRDWLSMPTRRAIFRLNLWLINRGWA